MPPWRIGCGAYGDSVTGPGFGIPSATEGAGRGVACATAVLAAIASVSRVVESVRVMRRDLSRTGESALDLASVRVHHEQIGHVRRSPERRSRLLSNTIDFPSGLSAAKPSPSRLSVSRRAFVKSLSSR